LGNRLSSGALVALLTTCAAVGAIAFPAAAGAATVTPASFTTCRGTLAPDSGAKQAGEPNLLDYKFQCDTPITAYSVIVNQAHDSGGAIDDFDSAPLVYTGDGVTPATGETVSCEGVLPSDGINCNTGTEGLSLGEYNYVAGTVDPIQAVAKAGTPAIPTAVVQLIVTDSTGAQDGPFTLRESKACPQVPNVVPAPPATKKSTSKKSTSKKSTSKKSTSKKSTSKS
jgi:hypothetical protein